MRASRYWRDWTPAQAIASELKRELTKPTKASSVSFVGSDFGHSKKNGVSDVVPVDDPAAWREPILRWINSECVLHPRWFGGLGCLHAAYWEWEIEHGDPPCTLDTFERLLTEMDLLIGEVNGVKLVSCLALRADFESERLDPVGGAS
jgi:hypothetical protein